MCNNPEHSIKPRLIMSESRKLIFFILLILILMSPEKLRAQNENITNSTLDTVVVTASNIEESKREVTANITVISEKEIKQSTAHDLVGLMSQKGIQTYQSGGASTIYIRGIGGTSMQGELDAKVVVLLNGHRVGSNNMSLRGLMNVERIEVIRGPAALQYGPSVGGVVNIITRRGQEGFTAQIEAGWGSFGRFDQKLSFSGAANGFDLAVGVSNTKRDDIKTGSGAKWHHTAYDSKFNIDLDAGYSFAKNHRLGVHYYYYRINDNEVPGSGFYDTSRFPNNYAVNDNYLRNTAFNYTGSTEDKLFSWSAEYVIGKNENTSTDFVTAENLYYGKYSPHYPNPRGSWDTYMDMDQARMQGTFDNGTLALTAGFDYLKYDYSTVSGSYSAANPSFYTRNRPTTQKLKDYAGYILAKLRLLDDSLIFSAGGRYDTYKSSTSQVNFSNSDNNFSPSVGVAWMPVDCLKLRANYAEGFRLPSPSAMLGDGTRVEPNLGLKPEKGKNFEIGADLAWKFIEANLTYFHTSYEDKIAAQFLSNNRSKNLNLDGKATYAGIELGLSADLGMALNQDFILKPYVNLTWMIDRHNRATNNVVPHDPKILPNVPKLTANYGISLEHPAIDLASTLNASYIGKSYTQDFSWYGPNSGKYVNHGGFTVVDLSLEKRLWDLEDKGHLSLRGEINNLFDKEYAYNLDYPMPGRNFYIGLSYNY